MQLDELMIIISLTFFYSVLRKLLKFFLVGEVKSSFATFVVVLFGLYLVDYSRLNFILFSMLIFDIVYFLIIKGD